MLKYMFPDNQSMANPLGLGMSEAYNSNKVKDGHYSNGLFRFKLPCLYFVFSFSKITIMCGAFSNLSYNQYFTI